MEIKILVFGSLIDLVGSSSIVVNLNEINNNEPLNRDVMYEVDTVIDFLKTKFPELNNLKFLVSVDRIIVHENTTIQPQSEIAILPPFSGG